MFKSERIDKMRQLSISGGAISSILRRETDQISFSISSRYNSRKLSCDRSVEFLFYLELSLIDYSDYQVSEHITGKQISITVEGLLLPIVKGEQCANLSMSYLMIWLELLVKENCDTDGLSRANSLNSEVRLYR
jgi:hypothetical protein